MVRQQQSSSFNRSGLVPTAEGVTTVDGELDVVGSLNVTGPAAFSGDTTIGGNAAITGTLSLPSGIINNDALTSPVLPGTSYGSAASFGITGTAVAKASVTATCPAGFSKLQVFAAGRVFAKNTTASGDWLSTAVKIGTDSQYMSPTGVSAGGQETSVAVNAALVTGLTAGSTVVISIFAASQGATWTADAANAADISASLLWLR
jgi:hypothetical protein